MAAEKEFFEYVPTWRGCRARWKSAREKNPAAVPDMSVEIHPLSSSEAKAVQRAAVFASMPRKGERPEDVQERTTVIVEPNSSAV